MQSLEIIATNGAMKSYRVTTARTVADLLKEMHLEDRFFAILANGKRVDLRDIIEQGAELTILPKIAGG